MNVMCIKGELPDDVCHLYTRANAVMDYNTVISMQDQYLDVPTEAPLTPQKAPDGSKKAPVSPEKQKASTVYKKLQRMLKFQMLKEEVLLNMNHTCDCCDRQFPTRSEWKASNPETTYPLMVRWTIPVITYITHHGLFDPKAIANDPKIFDTSRYYVLCNDCKPNKFFRK